MILKGAEHHESWALEHLQIWELLSLNNATLMFFCYLFIFFTYQVNVFFFFYLSGLKTWNITFYR